MTILLARHGSVDRGDQVLWGRTPVGLSSRGIEEAQRLAEALRAVHLDAVISSPERRTRQTAALIAARPGLPVEIDADLDEIDFGEWTGRTFRELDADPRWDVFNRCRGTATAPGGETTVEVLARACAALRRAGQRGSTVLLVTHAEIIRMLLLECMGLGLDQWPRVGVHPASLSVLSGTASKLDIRAQNLEPDAILHRKLHACR